MIRRRNCGGVAVQEDTDAPQAPPAGLLDADDVGRLLKCSRRTVYRLADTRRIPAPVRLGNLVRWNRRELEEWLEEGCPSCKRRR